jgi:hypothetical protein
MDSRKTPLSIIKIKQIRRERLNIDKLLKLLFIHEKIPRLLKQNTRRFMPVSSRLFVVVKVLYNNPLAEITRRHRDTKQFKKCERDESFVPIIILLARLLSLAV